jgi:hypothetical protein
VKLGSVAVTELRNQGYDFDVVDTGAPFPDRLHVDTCTELAKQLSKAIDASLASGPVEQRDAFREAAEILGVPTEDCFRAP